MRWIVSGELRVHRLAGRSDDVAAFAADLSGPVRATYEAGPTGFVLARKLEAIGVDCLVCAPGLIPRGPSDRVKTDRRDAERLVRLLAAADERRIRPRRSTVVAELELPVDERETVDAPAPDRLPQRRDRDP
jgi:transposase